MKKSGKKYLIVNLVTSTMLFATGWFNVSGEENKNSDIRDGIEYTIQTDRFSYGLGEDVEIKYKVTNLRNESITFTFPTGQEHDFSVEKKFEEGFREIWLWSWDKYFTQFTSSFTLLPNEYKEFNSIWPQVDGKGTPTKEDDTSATIGDYRISGFLSRNYIDDYETTSKVSLEIQIADYFPLKVGSFWEYNEFWRRDDIIISVGRETISGTEQIEDKTYFVFSPYHTDPKWIKLRENDSQIIVYDGQEKVLYKFSAPENETWTIDGWTVKIASRNETVSVPAGTFENTIKVEFNRNAPDASYIIEWFAPNIGVVKRVQDSFGGPFTYELINAYVNGVYIPPRNSTEKSWVLYE